MKRKTYTLITGASEGFGKGLAVECARRGMNLILVALPGSGLSDLCAYIQEVFKVDVHCFESDLCKDNECYHLQQKINDLSLDINVLINNAGLGSTEWFKESPAFFLEKQIKLNIFATTLLTRLFVDSLLKHKASYILNVGSLSSYFFLPKKTVYGSTKSYIYYFSKSLSKELKKDGVNVSVICPGPMNTNAAMAFQNRFSTWFSRNAAMNPEDVAKIAIDGLFNRKLVIIPGRMNRFFKFIDHFLPGQFKAFVSRKEMENQKLPSYNTTDKPELAAKLSAA